MSENLIFIHRHTSRIRAQLKASNWEEHTQNLWDSIASKRLLAMLSQHPNPTLCQYILEHNLIALHNKIELCVIKSRGYQGAGNDQKEYQMRFEELKILLIPSYFIQKCNHEIERLLQYNCETS